LHAADEEKLVAQLSGFFDGGNTVIVVDPAMPGRG
jgi:excinuclease UvrABC ATPase subunit